MSPLPSKNFTVLSGAEVLFPQVHQFHPGLGGCFPFTGDCSNDPRDVSLFAATDSCRKACRSARHRPCIATRAAAARHTNNHPSHNIPTLHPLARSPRTGRTLVACALRVPLCERPVVVSELPRARLRQLQVRLPLSHFVCHCAPPNCRAKRAASWRLLSHSQRSRTCLPLAACTVPSAAHPQRL